MDDNQSSRYIQTKTSGNAIASLISGIIGWILLPYIGALIAVYTGRKAKREIRESEGTLTGNGIATVGLVLGYSQLVVGVVAICIIIALTMSGPIIEDIFREIEGTVQAWPTPTP
jgi:hypothetical protein